MRARLHVQGTRVGFYREGSHDVCDAVATGQFLSGTATAIAWFARALETGAVQGVQSIEVTENVAGTERVCHVELRAGAHAARLRALVDEADVTGVAVTQAGSFETVAGSATVVDDFPVPGDVPARTVQLRRDARSFFQGNRYLLSPLVECVLSAIRPGPVLDLYAGVGLFGLSCAAARGQQTTIVEGSAITGADLAANAAPFADGVEVHQMPVEAYLDGASGNHATIIVDPPRSGLGHSVVERLLAQRPERLIYVSCDPATFARDTGLLGAGGWRLRSLRAFDLFPNTAHVEVVGVLEPIAVAIS